MKRTLSKPGIEPGIKAGISIADYCGKSHWADVGSIILVSRFDGHNFHLYLCDPFVRGRHLRRVVPQREIPTKP